MSISLFRSIANQYEHLRSISTVAMMNTVSHQIEQQVVNHRMPVEFFAGFQRFSRFPAQHRLYQQLGAVCRRVYVFGVADTKPPSIPGVEFVALDPTSSLSREWFLVVDTPEFWTVLSTQEADGRDAIGGGRRYDGVWTYDSQVVERASLLLSQELGTFYSPVRTRNYEVQSRHIAEISSRMTAAHEHSRLTSRRRWARMLTLQQTAEVIAKRPASVISQQTVARLMQTLFGAAEAAIAINTQGEHYSIITADGTTDGKPIILRASDGATGRAIAEATLVRVDDTHRERQRDPLLPSAQSLVVAPIVGQGRVYGALTIAGTNPRQWSDEDVQTVKGVASLLALACERDSAAASSEQADRIKKLERVLVSLRQPIRQLLDWEQRLRDDAGTLQPSISFLESLAQVEALSMRLAQVVGARRDGVPEVR